MSEIKDLEQDLHRGMVNAGFDLVDWFYELDAELHKLIKRPVTTTAMSSKAAVQSAVLHMADSTDAPVLPPGLDAYAGYIDGHWQSYFAIKDDARFATAHILPITVGASTGAPCQDIEPGNRGPDAAVPWWGSVQHLYERPCFYAARADMQSVLGNLNRAGIPRSRYRVWVAHPDGVPHLCSASRCGFGMLDDTDATQYAWNPGGVNIDLSLTRADFFGVDKPIPVHHVYDVLLKQKIQVQGRLISERDRYMHAAGALQQPVKYHNYLNTLYWDLKHLRDRVSEVSHHPLKDGKPTWGLYYRGARWQVMNAMMIKVQKAYVAHA